MVIEFITGHEFIFLINILFCLIAGILIGIERELKGKAAGISTEFFIITGAMIFTFVSVLMDSASPARIAAQVVTGVGFLGAGIILKSKGGVIRNLTTAAGIWLSASIGMLIGFKFYLVAMIAVLFSVFVPRIPRFGKQKPIFNKKNRK
ncbi:MgtC/SapB family protein [Candidatus Pacearchaeota archaeon]|nr:MgtC/SapB family protein [Candidatus Pacearchaeota archaeon]